VLAENFPVCTATARRKMADTITNMSKPVLSTAALKSCKGQLFYYCVLCKRMLYQEISFAFKMLSIVSAEHSLGFPAIARF
jgi:hypothetical protein